MSAQEYPPGYKVAPELLAIEANNRLARADFDINGNLTDAATTRVLKKAREDELLKEAEGSPITQSIGVGSTTIRGLAGAGIGAAATFVVEQMASGAGEAIARSKLWENLPPEVLSQGADLLSQAQMTLTLISGNIDENILHFLANAYNGTTENLTTGIKGVGAGLGTFWIAKGEDPISRRIGVGVSMPFIRLKSFIANRLPRSS